jgi:glucose/arabinose dehydrogenase
MGILLLFVALLVVAGCGSETEEESPPPEAGLDSIELPAGFTIEVVTDDVPGARSLTISPNGTLYVGTRSQRTIYAVTGADGGDEAQVHTVAENLNIPNGVAWHDGSLFVSEQSRVLRFDDIDDRLADPPDPVTVLEGLPDEDTHGWRYIGFGPDEMLYVSVGAPCNICVPDGEVFGSILEVDPASGEWEPYASGIRNSVGFDWDPNGDALWFTDNGADNLGNDVPPDELNKASEQGLHFGFPFCHGGDLADEEFGDQRSCEETVAPEIKLGPHVAALGMRFYTADLFPEEFHNQILIAEHGSWNRSPAIGYRISQVRVEDGEAVDYSTLADGWLQDGEAWGRPVDVEIAPDGSLFVSDDLAGAIYRITYSGDS